MVMEQRIKIFEWAWELENPFAQSVGALVCILVVILGSMVVDFSGLMDISIRFPWMTAAVFMLCFSVFNSVLSLKVKKPTIYFARSVYSFLILAIMGAILAYLFSGLAIGEAGSYQWIFIVVTICYLIFLTMVNLMKKIVDFAMKEEWNQPRIKNSGKN
jgi:uncharacterized membrane protein YtjA (UPF0391 family)